MDKLSQQNLRQELLDDIIKGTYNSNSIVNKKLEPDFRAQKSSPIGGDR